MRFLNISLTGWLSLGDIVGSLFNRLNCVEPLPEIILRGNMSIGTYEEPLPCGGKLKVSKASWEIQYYFPGPDLRHNGTFVSVPGNSIDQYISAFHENWAEYEKLKAFVPKGGEFTKSGKLNMTIRIGNFAQGVCLRSYHMPINSAQQLEKIVGGYRYAAQRAPQIQQFLASL